MNVLEKIPKKEELLEWYKNAGNARTLNVNNHIHTPYSFSAFKDIPQAIELAKEEGIKVLGINDFYVTDGYEEFMKECGSRQIFPLFNIEFIGLNKEDQKNNIRVNDPNNPGRTYFSGKGLDFPQKETPGSLLSVIDESQKQVADMIDRLNRHIGSKGYDLSFSMDEIYSRFAKKLIRERHIATALRVKASETFTSEEQITEFFTKIYDGKAPESSVKDAAAFENEIRGRLLKKGGAAFVEEDEKAFLDVLEVKELIIRMGGIPTYPVLLDNKNGEYTDFEAPKEKLKDELLKRGVYSVELIPNRNSFEHLKEFVKYFYNEGFVVSFGTEHNTPELTPLTVGCRNDVDLDEELRLISYNGAAVIAAHQYLRYAGETGYLEEDGKAKTEKRSEFEVLGKAVLSNYFNQI